MVKKGKLGVEEIEKILKIYCNNFLLEIVGSSVVCIEDYKISFLKNILNGLNLIIEILKFNVFIFYIEDGSKIVVCFSGIELKIKYYISVNGEKEEGF